MSKKKALSLSAITNKGKFLEKEAKADTFDVFRQNVEDVPSHIEPSVFELPILKSSKIEIASVVTLEEPESSSDLQLKDEKIEQQPTASIESAADLDSMSADEASARIFEELYWSGRKNRLEEKNFKSILEKESGREGYVIIPDALSFAINKFQVPPRAKTVLQVMIRHCLGYKVSQFELGYSYFVKATGIEKPNIAKAIQKLELLNIIQVENYINPNTKILSKKYSLEFIKPFISLEPAKKINEKASSKEIPEQLYKYFYSKNLSPSEWEKALELWSTFKEFHTEDEIKSVVEYVYQKGMVGGEFDGKRPVSVFGYLQKSFPYVLSRVNKSIKNELNKNRNVEEEKEEERIKLEEAKQLEEMRLKFNSVFPTADQKSEALEKLILKLREAKPSYASLPMSESVLIYSWATGAVVI